MTEHDDTMYLRHMLDAAEEARHFMEGRQRADLYTDRMLALALVKSIEIVGEAASKVSQQRQAELPDIPWPQIIGMRHRLVHDYSAIDYDIVWRVVHDELPELRNALRRSLRTDAD